MPKVKVNGVELNYEEHGSGDETLILGHGGSSSARSWHEVYPLLPDNYHCYALDFRGQGKSADITENISMPQMADDVYQFSREMGLGRFVYVGSSMGGRVGIDLAIAHSEVLKGAVLVVPVPARLVLQPDFQNLPSTPYAEWHTEEAIRARLAESMGELREPLSEERVQVLIEDHMVVKEATWLQIIGSPECYPDVEARLGEIKTPILMLISGEDHILPPDEQWRTVKQIPGAKAVFFEDERHPTTTQRFVDETVFFIDQLD